MATLINPPFADNVKRKTFRSDPLKVNEVGYEKKWKQVTLVLNRFITCLRSSVTFYAMKNSKKTVEVILKKTLEQEISIETGNG